MRLIIFALTLAGCASAPPPPAKTTEPEPALTLPAEDTQAAPPEAALPNGATLVFENDAVRVVRLRLAPGQRQDLHEGKPRIVISLTDAILGWTEGDTEKEVERRWQSGDVHFHGPELHAARNAGSDPVEYLVVAKRGAAAGGTSEQDLASTKPELAKVVFEGDGARVIRVDLPPGASTGVHEGRSRVVVSLTDYTLRWTDSAAGSGEKSWKKGDAHMHGPDRHEAVNVGATTASYLVVRWIEP